ncbi:type III secretion system chaperone [Pseudovibrio sp. Tun.PSC04-5.I4]|uniref:type III secretion system chaperone n=1 Tax=Pseudovibrio sp. Tun.PSC04-5.I4 TaxID=1798213 RepID=UPI00088A0276|nr:type III secretion system chaperone [Pseudovibrio sp. Tun.PSC04-5.I4]SDR14926.1 Tir chaperone protein (CesT) family protein [Pseudovibrio sp. Tun.PSC04-5.I4]
MLENLLKEACALLNVEAIEDEQDQTVRVVKLDAFTLSFKLVPDVDRICVSARLCKLTPTQRDRILELVLVYNTQSFQSGGMRLVLIENDALVMHNDLRATSWTAEKLAKFILAFADVSAGWLKIVREMGTQVAEEPELTRSSVFESASMISL